jgi:hypothetical protein
MLCLQPVEDGSDCSQKRRKRQDPLGSHLKDPVAAVAGKRRRVKK